jgi:hypothetical protein
MMTFAEYKELRKIWDRKFAKINKKEVWTTKDFNKMFHFLAEVNPEKVGNLKNDDIIGLDDLYIKQESLYALVYDKRCPDMLNKMFTEQFNKIKNGEAVALIEGDSEETELNEKEG